MKRLVVGAIAGSLATILVLELLFGLFGIQAERELINKWRLIHPGMPRAEVERILGSPSYDIKLGACFPDWAEKSVPEGYYLNHGLMVNIIKRIGPQLLLVHGRRRLCYVRFQHANPGQQYNIEFIGFRLQALNRF